ncbi:acyl-CoA thioesterase [Streptomyces sp. NPDC006527]|uniref:acyl-CoA thioesterase n=1 Tax=Streptomyces sp. NPDC006527 TaxID=3364749 RepID=UPI00368FBF48
MTVTQPPVAEPAGTKRPLRTADYPVRVPLATRWADNDSYGHVNNAVYYQYFDTVVNTWLSRRAGVRASESTAIGVVAESGCRYLREVSYPQELLIGLGCERLGRSSITYRLAVFLPDAVDGSAHQAAAVGRFVHVYVDREERRPVPIPQAVRAAVEAELLSTANSGGGQ